MKYLDFDLSIEPAEGGYCARVFHSPGGQAISSFAFPFSDLELENFLLRVGRSRQAVRRRVESSELAAAKSFGGLLFEGVFGGEVRGCLRSSLDEAHRQEAGLRVRLHLSKAPELANLPWEYLYNRTLNRFLSLSVDTPVVRYLDFAESVRALTVQPPLRILLMVSSPTDYPRLDVAREVSKMTDALAELERSGVVHVESQEHGSLAELQRRLRTEQFHIFHFVGHGGFDREAQDGYLLLEDGQGRGRRVGAQYIGAVLRDHRPLRLAVLNACEGARGSISDPFAGTAQSLVQQGIPAVIAMQFEVSDEAAICFTHEFYAALASSYPVDAALAEARKAIFAQVSETEWGTPVLYMRSPDGHIFDVQRVPENSSTAARAPGLASAKPARAPAQPTFAPAYVQTPEPREERKLPAESAQQLPRTEASLDQATPGRQSANQPAARARFHTPVRVGALGVAMVSLAIGAFVALKPTPHEESTNPATELSPSPTAPTFKPAQPSAPAIANAPPLTPSALKPVEPTMAASQTTPVTPPRGLANPRRSTTLAPEPVEPPISEEQRVRDCFVLAAQAETAAFEKLDPAPLRAVYSGELLAAYEQRLQQLSRARSYERHTLHQQRVTGVIIDEGRARAGLSEVWSITQFKAKTGQCLSYYRDYTVTQSALLRLEDAQWKIYALNATSPAPTPSACP